MPKPKAILLDLDGTVYRGNKVIPGVPQVISQLRARGMKIFFISNASMRTRTEYAQKLRRMGIPCRPAHIYNTAIATADYIARHYPRARVYVISEGGLKKELEASGIRTTHREDADVVATGLDTRLTYPKLVVALRAILNGAVFITSNMDRIYPTEKGVLPGSGTIAAFLEYGTQKKPIAIGKPEPHLIEAVLKQNRLKRSDVLVVGDNYETDLRSARRMGIRCAVVLTGITTKKDLAKLPPRYRPDFVLSSLRNLPSTLQ